MEANAKAGVSRPNGNEEEADVSATVSVLSISKQIDYNKVLTAFFKKHDPKRLLDVDKLLEKFKGKQPKLFLLLAKKYDCSNALNGVFVRQVTDEHLNDDNYLALTTLYLSVFFPQDVNEAEKLVAKHKKEDLFKKLASNFHAINPLKMERGKSVKLLDESISKPIDYKKLLSNFFEEHDEAKLTEVDETLSKAAGREPLLFALLASKYETSNALNSVFEERMKKAEINDYLPLLKLYLSVFHPSYLGNAKSLLLKNKGREEELFQQLAKKFSALNPLELEIYRDIGKGAMESIKEAGVEDKENVSNVTVIGSPKRSVRRASVPQSPAVTP